MTNIDLTHIVTQMIEEYCCGLDTWLLETRVTRNSLPVFLLAKRPGVARGKKVEIKKFEKTIFELPGVAWGKKSNFI